MNWSSNRIEINTDHSKLQAAIRNVMQAEYAKTEKSLSFDEHTLRRDIVAMWGEHGAHTDVYDALLNEVATLREKVQELATELLAAYEETK